MSLAQVRACFTHFSIISGEVVAADPLLDATADAEALSLGAAEALLDAEGADAVLGALEAAATADAELEATADAVTEATVRPGSVLAPGAPPFSEQPKEPSNHASNRAVREGRERLARETMCMAQPLSIASRCDQRNPGFLSAPRILCWVRIRGGVEVTGWLSAR